MGLLPAYLTRFLFIVVVFLLLAGVLNEGFSIPMRVCDRAAQAISHTTDKIKFDSEWTAAQKDEAIINLKHYCEESGPSNQIQRNSDRLRRSK